MNEDVTTQVNTGRLPPELIPQPIPLAFAVEPVPEIKHMAVTLFDVTGRRLFFLDPDAADEMARQLTDTANLLRSGLITPPKSGLILP